MNIIDQEAINHLNKLGKDSSFTSHVIDTFIKNTPVFLRNIDQSLTTQNADLLQSTVHKFKSSSHHLGARELEKLCLEVEKLAKSGQHSTPEVLNKIDLIKVESAKVIEALNQLRGQL